MDLKLRSITQTLKTLAISSFGVALFWMFHLPLPFLFGPLFASLIAALLGVRLKNAGQIAVGARTILGIAVGTTITPTVLYQIPKMFASLVLIPLYLSIIALVGFWFFHRICKLDKATSYYSAMPGGLQDMVIFGQEAGGNIRALSLIHATRVLVIVTLAPFILTQMLDVNFDSPVGTPASDLPIFELILMLAAAIIGWKGGEKIRLFGATILGPLIVSGAMSIIGLIHYRPPSEAILFAQFFIGTAIGVGYVGITLSEIRMYVLSGFGYVIFLCVLAFIFTEFVIVMGLASPLNSFLAFLPGGQAEMTIIAIIVGADLGYVVIHHLTRLVLVITGAPLFGKLIR